MFFDVVPNRKSPPTVLIRHSYREGGKVKKRTLANITKLPPEMTEKIRGILRGTSLADAPGGGLRDAFGIVRAVRSAGVIRPSRPRLPGIAPTARNSDDEPHRAVEAGKAGVRRSLVADADPRASAAAAECEAPHAVAPPRAACPVDARPESRKYA